MKTKQKTVLEQFPAWQACRELNRVASAIMKNKNSGKENFFERNNITNLTEAVMSEVAVAYEKYEFDKERYTARFGMLENISTIKSKLYALFDTNYISHEEFATMLVLINQVRTKVVKFFRETKEKEKAKANANERVPTPPDDLPPV
ncbi:MAG: hypothetical protein WCJ94_07250 [bacterium]